MSDNLHGIARELHPSKYKYNDDHLFPPTNKERAPQLGGPAGTTGAGSDLDN